MISSVATLGLAAAFSAAANLPTPQTIAFSASPVQVTSCAYTAVPSLSATSFDNGYAPSIGNLRISFVNLAPVAATRVSFAVTEDGQTRVVEDNGTFSTGTAIDHEFTAIEPQASGLGSCAVASVSFADGTSWNAGS